MIQSVDSIFGFQDKKLKSFFPFSDSCKMIQHKDGSISIRIPKEEGVKWLK